MSGYDKYMVRDHAPGWVYLFGFPMVNECFYKIGLSRKPFQRLNQLKKEEWCVGCVTVAAAFWTDDMARDETYLIETYNEYKTNDGNEYFRFHPDVLVDVIRTTISLSRDARYREMQATAKE